jgi:hypothetical protein
VIDLILEQRRHVKIKGLISTRCQLVNQDGARAHIV